MALTLFRKVLTLQKQLYNKRWFHILGIETSCDDTGCAIVDESGNVLGASVISQEQIHLMNGGIIPPIAGDLHKENIKAVVDSALQKSNLGWADVDAIAVTVKPGLALSLLVGMNYAKDLSTIYRKPVVPIHHMEAHTLTIRMLHEVPFPFLVLLISGGHCLLALAEDVDRFLLLGESIDDAPGEAFDKVARRLKLRNMKRFSKMCGGAAIEMASKQGNPLAFTFPGSLLQYRDCNFSFSGLKASARTIILQEEETHDVKGDGIIPSVFDVCASFQWGVTKHLCWRVQRAVTYLDIKKLIPENRRTLVVSGGVACNGFIKTMLTQLCDSLQYQILVPPPKLCTDNGIMIAWNGVEKWRLARGIVAPENLSQIDISPKCKFGDSLIESVTEEAIKCKWIKLQPVWEQSDVAKH